MLPDFLIPETLVREDGSGPAVEIGAAREGPLRLVLGITRILEQESLEVSVSGSADGTNWSPKPLASFPQKFYTGVYETQLDLAAHPDVGYLRVEWKLGRWGRGEEKPLFTFYVFAEPAARTGEAAATRG